MSREEILIIKHGALGDIILATAAFRAIREEHSNAYITILTTKPFAELLAKSPYFNEIWVDSKPRLTDRKAIGRLKTMLNSKRWEWVYDLQTSKRTTLYPWLLKRPWPKISGANRWSSHKRPTYDTKKHALENLRAQMAIAGIHDVGLPDIGWMEDTNLPPLPLSFALLVPGGAAHRPEKRWPAEQYASLASELVARGIIPVLIGTAAEKDALDSIATRVPQSINLGGKTSITGLATLARAARLAVGNDTGPMHVIAAAGCPSTVIFSYASDPARSAPVGETVTVLRERNLSELSVDRVLSTLVPRP